MKYSVLKRFSYIPFFGGEAPQPKRQFDNEAIDALNKTWEGAWLMSARHDKNGVHLIAQNGGSVHIQKNKVTVSANAEDATLRSLVLHAKVNWKGTISPGPDNNNTEQLAGVWAHCQVHGVNFSWEPPSYMAKQLKEMVRRLNAQEYRIEQTGAYPSYGEDGITYRAPVFAAAQIPYAGARPDYAGLKARSAAERVMRDVTPRFNPGLNGVAEQSTANGRAEREAFLRAREAGKISINDIDDWGMRMRLTAADRDDKRQNWANSQRPLPTKPSVPGMRL